MSAQQDRANAAPSDVEIALFLEREKHRLSEMHHDFIDCVASRFKRFKYWPGLTPKQHQYLHSLFHELGGKIT